MMRALILGGTGDANALAAALVRAQIDAIYSYAGRTQIPLPHALPTRIGGFGGAADLPTSSGKSGSRMSSTRRIPLPPR